MEISDGVRVELQRTVTMLRELFSAAACSCALVEEDGASLRFTVADGVGADKIVGVQLPVTRGIAGWSVMSGEAISISDVDRDARFARDVAQATDYVPRTVLVAPIEMEDEVIGVLEVLDPRSGGDDTGRDLATLGLVASQVAGLVRLAAPDRGPTDGDSQERLGALLASLSASAPGARGLVERLLVEVVEFVDAGTGGRRPDPRERG